MKTEAKYRAEIRAEIERLQKIEAAMDGKPSSGRGKGAGRKLSKKAREAIGAAQRRRWAKVHAAKKKAAA